MNDAHTMEQYSATKMKNESFAICNNTDGDRPGGYYASKISKTEKDKYFVLSLM